MRHFLTTLTLISTTACSALPSTGPRLATIQNYKDAQVIDVTTTVASSMLSDLKKQEADKLNNSLNVLSKPILNDDHLLTSGDHLTIELMTWSPVADATGSHQYTTSWKFEINGSGMITLPYTKQAINVSGLTLNQSERLIADTYVKQKIFVQPSVHVTLDTTNSLHGVVVTGNIGQPKIIPWVPGGMSLAQVVTTALGDGTILGSQQSELNGNKSAITVTVVRKSVGMIDLPIDEAFKRDIPVAETDKIIVTKKPVVQVTTLGGGIGNGLFGFDHHPTLNQVIALAKGLNPGTANAKAIFVFRNNQSPILYSFSYKSADAQFATQQFPLMDGDIVYVAEAPIVPITQVLSSIWPVASISSFAH